MTIGVLSLIHAGYSTIQYRTYLKLIEEDFANVPVDIMMQVLLSVGIAVFGIVRVAGELKDIHAAAELAGKSWESLDNRPSFYHFNHRGRRIFAEDIGEIEE